MATVAKRLFWTAIEYPAAVILWLWVRLVFATVRFNVEGQPLDRECATIYVSWHRHNIVLCPHHGSFHRWLMVSPAPYLASVRRVASWVGLRLAVGTSGDGGARALDELVAALGRGESVSISADGPGGPAFRAKRGVALLAQRTGAPIVPVAYQTRRGRTLRRRWDRMLWVGWFDVVTIRYGPPIIAGDRPQQAVLADVERALGDLDPEIRS